MEKIASFTVDHDILEVGIYVSRIDGDITTYDLRFIKPNTPPFLTNGALHTIEHLFATYMRNSRFGSNIIYFGPMGCRTGFYLIVRDLSNKNTIELIKETLLLSIAHTGDIPGNSKKECGNYLDHDIEGAKEYMQNYYNAVKDWTIYDLQYKN
ncbi:MAG: S-ribosylhomocysteine lyase [Ruminococcus sp.]|nr:S-ribosylhomocysteine lyase [Ruminococcus sp.]